jgi:outer membrane lipoprotein SlyB
MESLNNTTPGQTPANGNNSKPLWAAVGILGVAVLAMGGTMLYQRPAATEAVPVAALTTPAPIVATAPKGLVAQSGGDDLIEKPVPAPVKPTPAPIKKVVTQAPRPAPLTYSNANGSPAYSPQPQRQVCLSCGTVESVTPVQRSTKAEGPGLGAVAGGVLGAVLGNQVGHGNGRAAATVLGAVGGGYAGNAIEGNMKKVTVYQVGVRMEDGSRRTVEISQAPSVGSAVTVEGANLRLR